MADNLFVEQEKFREKKESLIYTELVNCWV